MSPDSPEPDTNEYNLTPRTEAKYTKIDEEFQMMMQRNQHNGTRVRAGFFVSHLLVIRYNAMLWAQGQQFDDQTNRMIKEEIDLSSIGVIGYSIWGFVFDQQGMGQSNYTLPVTVPVNTYGESLLGSSPQMAHTSISPRPSSSETDSGKNHWLLMSLRCLGI